MSYTVDASSEEMEAYIIRLKAMKARLEDYINSLNRLINSEGWNDHNREIFNSILIEIIRELRSILEAFDPPIMVLEKKRIIVEEMQFGR